MDAGMALFLRKTPCGVLRTYFYVGPGERFYVMARSSSNREVDAHSLIGLKNCTMWKRQEDVWKAA